MATAFAALEARLGASIERHLFNATALVLSGGEQIDGLFVSSPVEASLGQAGMLARDVMFTCNWAEAQAAGVEIGSGLQVTYKGTVAVWEVARITEVNDVGHASIVLEAPQP